MKKKISLYMALIIAFGLIAPATRPLVTLAVPASANAMKLDADLNRALVTDANSYTPKRGTSQSGQAELSWPITGFDVGDSYVLSWHPQDNQLAELIVTKASDFYRVTFQLYDDTTGLAVTSSTLQYFVYKPSPNAGFYRIDQFFQQEVNYDNLDKKNRVNTSDQLDLNNPDTYNLSSNALKALNTNDFLNFVPSFNLLVNNGFTFRYFDYEIGILLDGDTFRVSTNKLQQGRLYDFTLEYQIKGVPSAGLTNKKTVFPGIDMSTFAAIPIAEGKNPDWKRSVWNKQLENEPDFVVTSNGIPNASSSFDTTVISMQDPTEATAADKNGLSIRFDLPKVYSTSTHTFIDNPSSFTEQLEIQFVLTYGPSSQKNTITLQAYDIFNFLESAEKTNETNHTKSPNVSASPAANQANIVAASRIMGFASANAASRENPTNRVEIIYTGLPSGTIINPARVEYVSGTIATPRETNIYDNYRPVFTFLEYDVQLIGEQLYLAVTPYANTQGEYRLMSLPSSAGSANDYIIQQDDKYTVTLPASADTLYFPLDINPLNPSSRVYQIQYVEGKFNSSTNKLVFSQLVHYEPNQPALSVGSPNNFRIMKGPDQADLDAGGLPIDKSVKLYPVKDNTSGNFGLLEFWTQWDLGNLDTLYALVNNDPSETLVVTYDVHTILSPMNDPNNQAEWFDTITLTITKDTSGGSTTGYSGLLVEYASAKDPARILNPGPQPLKVRANNNNTVYTCYADIHFLTDAVHKDYVTQFIKPYPFPVDFLYPNIYFMNVQPVTLNGAVLAIPASSYDNMTLSDISPLTVPSPANLTAVPITVRYESAADQPAIRVNYSIPLSGIKQFLASMYPYEYPEITVNLYIGEYEDAIRNNFYPTTGAPGLNERINLLSDGVFDYKNLAVTTTTSGSALQYTPELDLTDARDVLRNARNTGVVCITDIPLFMSNNEPYETRTQSDLAAINRLIQNVNSLANELLLTGLDINQKYYIFLDLVVTQWDFNVGDPNNRVPLLINGVQPVNASPLTSLVGVTTAGVESVPSDTEKSPTAPHLWADDIEQTAATIYWDKVYPEANDEVSIEYEIIRLKDHQMSDDDFASMEVNFATFFTGLTQTEKIGWRTNKADLEMLSGGAFSKVTGRDKYDYYPDYPNGDPVSLRDKTLLPNQLYFYYVRTVRIVQVNNDPQLPPYEKRLVSSWNRVSVTTTPVQAPFNLKVENNREDYNRQTEIIVSFDSPLVDITRMGLDYEFQYQIKADDGEWSEPRTVWQRLEYSTAADGQSMHFVYKITGLTPGTLYSLRVRMYDLITKDGSMYSNIVQFKTDINQEDYDNAVKQDDWLYYLQKQLEALLTDPYWVALETPSQLVVVYRPDDMFNGLLQATANAQILLYNNNADSVTYYFPASVILKANGAEKGFRSMYGDLDLLFSPKMLNENYNDAMLAMAKEIKAKTVSDYFIRVTVTRSAVVGQVEGEQPLGKQTRVDIAAVGTIPSIVNIKTWDANLYKQFAKLVNDKINDPALKQSFLARIKANTVSEDMVAYVDQLVKNIRNELMQSIYRQMNTSGILSTRSATAEKLDAAMHLVSKGLASNTVIYGYQAQNGVWMPKDVTDYYNGKAITTRTPGTFVFAGRAVNIPGIDETPQGGTISAFTAKYGLEDYLGRDGVNLSQSATRQMVAGCIARMAGAPKSADPITWVSANLNMTLSSRNATGNVQTQEALAMIMALYEKKTNTKIANMTIRNFNVTANMTGLDDRYVKAVRAAFEVGIVTDTGLQPANAVTIGALLDMLAALDSKIKL